MAVATLVTAYFDQNRGVNVQLRGGPERPLLVEGTGQTWIAGAPIYSDGSSNYVACTSGGAGSGAVNTPVSGFALANASGVAGTLVRYRALMPGQVLIANIDGSATTTVTQALVGNQYNFTLTGGGLLVLNPDFALDTTKLYGTVEDMFVVTNGYGSGDNVGDTYGRVVVMVPAQSCLRY